MNGHSPRSTFTSWLGNSWYRMTPSLTMMPGLMEWIDATWPGELSSPRRSVKWTLVVRPWTGPNGAARSMLAVEKSPAEVTAPDPDQLILP